MANKSEELKMFTFNQIKDKFIGKIGSKKRTQYEQKLQLEVLKAITDKS